MPKSSPKKTRVRQVPPKASNQLEKLSPQRLPQLRKRKKKRPLLFH